VTHLSKRKGNGFEREVVRLLQALRLVAEKRPLSGARCRHGPETSASNDAAEAAALYGMLGSAWGLVVRDDRTEPLVVLRLKDFAELAKAAPGNVTLAAAQGQQLTVGTPQLGDQDQPVALQLAAAPLLPKAGSCRIG
jgi:hypothetical protein